MMAASTQLSIFGLENMAQTAIMPKAPALIPHTEWPFPGLTPVESAQACIAQSEGYTDMLAAVIQSRCGEKLISKQVMALIPQDWRNVTGRFAHGSIGWTAGEQRGIKSEYVSHDGGGFHFTYQAIAEAA